MSFDGALKAFEENIQILGGERAATGSQPEKYNLYAGLGNLCRGLNQLQFDIQEIKGLLNRLRKGA